MNKIKKAKEKALSRGGECLSETCNKVTDKLKWICDKNHTWITSYSTVINSSWCPECSYEKKRLSIEKINKIVGDKFGGLCISKKYKNNQTKLLWQCKKGHIWSAIYGNIQNHNRWCPHCAGNAKLNINQMNEIASKRGGKCNSIKYTNNHTKLSWECFIGHRWEMRPNDVIQKGNWCPECNNSIGDRCCKIIFEKSTGRIFKKIRPDWLKNHNGNNLELDGYCSSLNIAFEYNGVYHNELVFTFHDENDLKKVKTHDEIKRNICADLGIKLFVINEPRPFSLKKIKEEIKRKVDFNVVDDINNIDLLVYANDKLEKYREIAKLKEGSCLDNKWINSQYKLRWKCKNNHIFEATPNGIQQGKWCPKCK